MKKYYLHCTSCVSFNLFVNGKFVDSCKAGEYIDLICDNDFNYMFLPISDNDNYISYSGNITLLDLTQKHKYLDVVPFLNNHYEINFIPQRQLLLSNYSHIMTEKVKNIVVDVYNNNVGIIDVIRDGVVENRQFLDTIAKASIDYIQDKIVVSCMLQNSKMGVYVVDANAVITYTKIGDSVEINGDKIKVMSECNDVFAHAMVEEYNIIKNELNSYAVYLKKINYMPCNCVLPAVFMQSIMVKDYALAKTFLSTAFSQVEPSQISNYFGDIQKLYYNKYLMDDKINYTVDNGSYHSFTFVIKDNKIDDIVEEQLQ